MSANELLSPLKTVAETTRLRMLELLHGWDGPRAGPVRTGERGLCLSDLELLVGLPHALVSHHLRILKEAGLVETERRGRWTVYRPCPERVAMVAESLRAVGSTHKLPGGPSLSAA